MKESYCTIQDFFGVTLIVRKPLSKYKIGSESGELLESHCEGTRFLLRVANT